MVMAVMVEEEAEEEKEEGGRIRRRGGKGRRRGRRSGDVFVALVIISNILGWEENSSSPGVNAEQP